MTVIAKVRVENFVAGLHTIQKTTVSRITYFNKPWAKLLVKHNVKAENFKADRITRSVVTRPTRSVRLIDVWKRSNYGLDKQVSDGAPERRNVKVAFTQILVEVLERSFATRVNVSALLVMVVVLVHRVICQVHEGMFLYTLHEQCNCQIN